jgi:hypothetical protein
MAKTHNIPEMTMLHVPEKCTIFVTPGAGSTHRCSRTCSTYSTRTAGSDATSTHPGAEALGKSDVNITYRVSCEGACIHVYSNVHPYMHTVMVMHMEVPFMHACIQ